MGLNKEIVGTVSGVLMSAFVAAQSITITYSNGETREFDCTELYEQNGKLYMTGDAFQKIDQNHTKIGLAEDELSKDPKTRQYELSQNLVQALIHMSRSHSECGSAAIKLEGQLLGEEKLKAVYENIYGDDWKEEMQKQPCTLIEVNKACKQVLGL